MVRIIFFGDVHGNICRMYEEAELWERTNGKSIDFIVQVGDFEAIRNDDDINLVLGPKRFRKLGDFHKYYSGDLRAPMPTYFIGGNHENYDFLDSNYPNDFEVAENIFYLGRSGVINLCGLNLGFLSGIERLEYFDDARLFPAGAKVHSNNSRKKAIYYNAQEFSRLGNVPLDVLISHNVPESLFGLGAQNKIDDLVQKIKPRFFFCGHLHRTISKTLDINGSSVEAKILAHIGKEGDSYILDSERINCAEFRASH